MTTLQKLSSDRDVPKLEASNFEGWPESGGLLTISNFTPIFNRQLKIPENI
jgi:hypothetical protein